MKKTLALLMDTISKMKKLHAIFNKHIVQKVKNKVLLNL